MPKKFTRFTQNEWAGQARFEILQTRPGENPRQVCLDPLEVVGQIDRFNNLVTGPLRAALCTRLHSVHEYNMEFYSTFALKAKVEPFDNEDVIFLISKVYMIFCRKTLCEPVTPTIWQETRTPGMEL
ncbi:hypothetical protein Hanom_Chr14g01277031 [Helianthus anomalus]